MDFDKFYEEALEALEKERDQLREEKAELSGDLAALAEKYADALAEITRLKDPTRCDICLHPRGIHDEPNAGCSICICTGFEHSED